MRYKSLIKIPEKGMVKNNHTDVIFVLCDILLLLPNK
jgi:hypothetical protein